MKKNIIFSCLLLSVLSLTAACGLTQTSYERPALYLPAVWVQGDGQKQAAEAKGLFWWKAFGDETLNRLVEEALSKNNDLAVAALRVREARLRARLAADQYVPDLSASGSGVTSFGLREGGGVSSRYAASADARYELDLWGKIASEKDSAVWEARATQEDKESAAIALIGTTVNLYWQIAYLNERIALSSASIDSQKKIVELVRVQNSLGATSAIERASAERGLAAQEAAHTQLLQQKVEAMNAFDILFDGPPGTRRAHPMALPKGALPRLSAHVPMSLLARRPDLRAAEYRLREYLSDVDATRLSYLPSFSLTGSLGSSSATLSRVLTDPVGTLGAGLALPFLSLFDMSNTIALSETTYEAAVVAFRQTVYNALSDVDNALSARAKNAEQGARLLEALGNARKVASLYAVQYKEGYIPLQTWLDAQESLRSAEVAVLENRYRQFGDCVTLYKALGGEEPAAAF